MPTDSLTPLSSVDVTSNVMVLLVDDQALVGEIIRRMLLNQEGIDFHFCSDADKAMDTALLIKPTVILQDLVMPGVDGLDLVKRYKSHDELKDIPVIVLSAKDEPAVKCSAFATGANDYLVKLPDAVELLARLRYHSKAYLALKQRDEIFKALRNSQQQLLETNLQLEKLMRSDALTALFNRRHFDECIEIEWKRAAREQAPLSLLMIDVDYFKYYNDTFGHVAGDVALQKIAQVIKNNCYRPADVAARYGGEEFVVLLPNTNLSGACLVAEKIRQQVQEAAITHVKPAENSCVTVSIGVASILPDQQQQTTALIRQADDALYQAKAAGKNQYAPQQS
ncbi:MULTISPECIES: diguanylate cyclase [Rheinheimera]|uniref:diguanylate cyclase n=1 Tax=Rheinheimera marina TaxID=1774958 RepID=A0ABV9JH13_9GAMM